MKRILILALPIVLVACVEVLLRLGAWEPFAEPRSHAGLSVRLKDYLESPALAHIDFVTLGSSRPQHGIDHEQLADLAIRYGKSHVNMSLPGTHWMTIGVLTDWLQLHHPEIRGGIIALSIQDFSAPGNGDYELEIIQPFRKFGDQNWVEAHVPFEQDQPSTWASRFSLMAWRDDIRNFIQHPFKRLNRARKVARKPHPEKLFGNQDLTASMCATGIESLASCDRLEVLPHPDEALLTHCKQIRRVLADRPDFKALLQEPKLPASVQRLKDMIQSQLRSTTWGTPPVIVLMPTAPILRDGVSGKAVHQWALQVLEPLEEEGTLRIVDATDFFDNEPGYGCARFADFYHQNVEGRSAFSAWLIPQIEAMLYADRSR